MKISNLKVRLVKKVFREISLHEKFGINHYGAYIFEKRLNNLLGQILFKSPDPPNGVSRENTKSG